MIYCLSGELLFTDAVASTAVIDCCGVGYKVTVTSNTLRKLPMNPEKPPRIRLLTYMQVREDGVDLFGFYTAEELDMFKMLISVSGVGPKAAVSILSLMTPEKLSLSIATEDVKAISKAPGVKLVDDLSKKMYPMPLDTSDQDIVFVGRIRPDLTDDCGVALWCCGDQVRKGAATNAIQIAELLTK